MITVYYVRNGATFEDLREAYLTKEQARFPDRHLRELSYLGNGEEELNGREIKYEKHVTFENLLKALKPNSRVIVDNFHVIQMPILKLKETLFMRKDEYLQIRILDPNILLDPFEKQTYALLDFASVVAEAENKKNGQANKSFKKIVVSASRNDLSLDDFDPEDDSEIAQIKKENEARSRANLKPNLTHPKSLRDKILADRMKGMTYVEVIKKYKVSSSFIAQIQRENNIKIEKKETILRRNNIFIYKTPECVEPKSFIDQQLRDFLLNQRKLNTSTAYYSLLKVIFSFLAPHAPKGKIEEISDILKFDLVMEYKNKFEEKKSTDQAIKFLKIFLRHLHAQGYNFVNKISLIKTKKYYKDRTRSIAKDDVKKLLHTAREFIDETRKDSVEAQWQAHRDFLAVFLLASCGMRHTALLHIRKKDLIISSDTGSAKLRLLSKTMNCHYEINICQDIVLKIQNYIDIFLATDPPETYLFCHLNRPSMRTVRPIEKNASSQNLRKIYKRSGVKLTTNTSRLAHSLRVTFATQLYESGVDIHKIKELLNHTNVNQTYQYIDVGAYENVISTAWLPDISNNVPLSV